MGSFVHSPREWIFLVIEVAGRRSAQPVRDFDQRHDHIVAGTDPTKGWDDTPSASEPWRRTG
jgi:hypothetical protein